MAHEQKLNQHMNTYLKERPLYLYKFLSTRSFIIFSSFLMPQKLAYIIFHQYWWASLYFSTFTLRLDDIGMQLDTRMTHAMLLSADQVWTCVRLVYSPFCISIPTVFGFWPEINSHVRQSPEVERTDHKPNVRLIFYKELGWVNEGRWFEFQGKTPISTTS